MELLDIVNENNELTGKVEDKEKIHQNGIFHREVAVWIMNKNGEILLQKRAATKKQHPNKWALTAGHVDAGEDVKVAAKRECLEELGINIKELKNICITKNEETHLNSNQQNNYFGYHFFIVVDYNINDYKIQKEELSEVKYISLEELERILKNKDENYVFSKRTYMPEIVKYLYNEKENIKNDKKRQKYETFLHCPKCFKKEDFMRRKVIAGNWKMNMLPNEAIDFIEKFAPQVEKTNNEVILCVPYTDLFYALLTAQGTNVKIGAQNMHFEETGAYTGEVSGKMLKSIGVEYVIIGHSERRQYFNETDETVNKKIKAAFANELKPIVCVGETLEQREANKTEEIITKQTELALQGLTQEQVENTIIAYEPIWAIGTGKTATAEDANNSIKSIRDKICQIYGQMTAERVIIQYGGSVKSANAKELFEMSDIDGGLVGGASLKPDEFAKIVNFED